MTKRKPKPNAATRSIARKTAKPASPKRSAPAASKSPARSATKQDRIIAMLRTSAGATIASLVAATGWQQHSMRGFLAGVVRKKLGLNLVSEQTDKGVTQNGRQDYFGRTVNIAARVQNLAVSRSILATGRVVENLPTSMLLTANNLTPVAKGVALRDIADDVMVYEIP